jgi:membrane protein DedA with SNARE-associated domain
MDLLANVTLNHLLAFGAPVLLLIAFIGSLGIPFPITAVIMAAGALSRQEYFEWQSAFLACLAGSAIADHCEYVLGRFAGKWIDTRFSKKTVWQKAQLVIKKQGGWAIFLTRFWLTPLAPMINFIAGTRFSYPRFLLFDLTGEILWVFIYGGLGYIFMDQWESISHLVNEFSLFSFVLAALAVVIYLVYSIRKRRLTSSK